MTLGSNFRKGSEMLRRGAKFNPYVGEARREVNTLLRYGLLMGAFVGWVYIPIRYNRSKVGSHPKQIQ